LRPLVPQKFLAGWKFAWRFRKALGSGCADHSGYDGRRWVKKLELQLKKSFHASERETEANRLKRQQFIERIRATPPGHLIFLDESGVMTSMTRLRGRCLGGQRIHETTPGGHWKIMTILGAMSLSGMVATITIEEATDADIFLAYVEQVLSSVLKTGDVVVIDNLSSH
jgi:hypothetical protein